jgi:hypothetical protein
VTRDWQPVELATWSDFFMALRAVLLELPPGTQLLLRPVDDDRAAHIATGPKPRVEIRAGQTRLASLPCDSITDVIDHVETNVHEHWELDTPGQLLSRFDGPVAPRLRTAFTDDEIIGDLPEGERPSPLVHSEGEEGGGALGGQISPEMLERLRAIGRDD